MDFSTAVRTCLQQYATFTGRATRPEYWWFVLFSVIVLMALALLAGLFAGPLLALLGLALLPPSLAAAARRLHDTGRSGWWQLGPAVPNLLAGMAGAETTAGTLLSLLSAGFGLVLVWWLARPGDPQPNAFGPPPGRFSPAPPAGTGGGSWRS